MQGLPSWTPCLSDRCIKTNETTPPQHEDQPKSKDTQENFQALRGCYTTQGQGWGRGTEDAMPTKVGISLQVQESRIFCQLVIVGKAG